MQNMASWIQVSLFVALLSMCQSNDMDIEYNTWTEAETVELMNRLLTTKRVAFRPEKKGGPTEVIVDMFMSNFGPLDEAQMDFSVEIYLRQEWHHPDLQFDDIDQPLTIPYRHTAHLWMPDLFFPNEKSSTYHDLLYRNGIVIIHPNGTVKTSARLTLHLHCKMNLQYFPFDQQTCSIQISSYAFTNDTLVLKWRHDPLEINEHSYNLPDFHLEGKNHSRCTQSYKTGNYDCLEATFHFRRLVGYYLLQNFLPCHLIVMLSWVSFWINRDSIAARISLGVTTILTLTTQLSTFREGLQVSYPKAIDTWYTICNSFVFAALLEFTAVNVLTRAETEIKEHRRSVISEGRGEVDPTATSTWIHEVHHQSSIIRFKEKLNNITAKDVDRVSRLMFPLLYLIVSCIYGIYYVRL